MTQAVESARLIQPPGDQPSATLCYIYIYSERQTQPHAEQEIKTKKSAKINKRKQLRYEFGYQTEDSEWPNRFLDAVRLQVS